MGLRARLFVCSVLVAAWLAVALASASQSSFSVRLALPGRSLHAGQQVSATFVNHTSETLELGLCPTLAQDVADRWVTVTHTHGVDVACPHPDPVSNQVKPYARQRISVELYDDLAPGTYRFTLPYREARFAAPPLSANSSAAAVTFRVTRFDPGPAPHLSESRLLAIALKAATADGDPHPTRVQYGEGSRLAANLVGNGDLIFAWNWSYLIAERGAFGAPAIDLPPGIPSGRDPVDVKHRVITLVIDARTGQVTDAGGSDRYPDMARLGAITTPRGG